VTRAAVWELRLAVVTSASKPFPVLPDPSKLPFDIEDAVVKLREAVAPYPQAALFVLAGDGFTSVFEQLVARVLSIRTRDGRRGRSRPPGHEPLGYVRTTTPGKTMAALEDALAREYRVEINALLVPFGKHVCTGVRPRCPTCPLLAMCRRVGVTKNECSYRVFRPEIIQVGDYQVGPASRRSSGRAIDNVPPVGLILPSLGYRQCSSTSPRPHPRLASIGRTARLARWKATGGTPVPPHPPAAG